MIRKIQFMIACLCGITCLCLSTATADAQELNVWLDGGPQGLSYKVPNGQNNLQFGGSLGLGYTFPIRSHWALLTGVTGGWYNTQAKLNNGTYSSDQVDNTGSAFVYKITTTDYKETQQFFSFGVPLLLQYHTTGARTQWYINGGGKLLLPFYANIKSSAKQLALSGYYPDVNVELSNLPQHGFGTLQNWQVSTMYKLKTGAALDAETGLSFKLSPHTRLYAGLYLEYGLNNIRGDNAAAPLILYNPNGVTGAHTGVLGGSVLNLPSTGSAKLLSYGLMIKFGFGHGRHKSAAKAIAPAPGTTNAPAQASGATQAKVLAPLPDTAQNRSKSEPVKQGLQEKPQEQVAVIQKVDSVQTPQKQEPETAQAPQNASRPVITLEEIQTVEQQVVFGIFRKTDLAEDQKPHLDAVAAILNKYPDIRIRITGHTCSIGTKEENISVGDARALAVADYLQVKGVDPGRMDVRSDGESKPIVPNNSPENRSRNRRVTILYLSASQN